MREHLDQYYTQPMVAKKCIEAMVSLTGSDMAFMEPSAGTGAFVAPLRKTGHDVTAIDLEPKGEGIIKGNFLTDDLFPSGRPLAVIGNPPFGWAANLAIKFFNRAAERADYIGFIVPRTFRKDSVQERLNPHFWNVLDDDIETNAFLRQGKAYDVPCIFQVWERRDDHRPYEPTPDISDVVRYTSMSYADFGFRRVGGRAGEVFTALDICKPTTTYFMQSIRRDAVRIMREVGELLRDIRDYTAGPRSLSKREIAFAVREVA